MPIARVLAHEAIAIDTALYNATTFSTSFATINARAALFARGHNTQQRHDLRPVGVALCCTRNDRAISLFHQVDNGAGPNFRMFADVLPQLRARFVAFGGGVDGNGR